MVIKSGVVGWFGKVGPLGDFATRRFSEAQTGRFDAWLSDLMLESRRLLGEQWTNVFLAAPLWRYAWAPGVLDDSWWFGVLMPSCDAVGRYFPLLLGQSRRHPPQDGIALDHLELWWERLAQAALMTLTNPCTIDSFETSLSELPPWPTARAGMSSMVVPGFPDAVAGAPGQEVAFAWPASIGLAEVTTRLASRSLMAQLQGWSVWWPHGNGRAAAPMTLIKGLPDGETFVRLMRAR